MGSNIEFGIRVLQRTTMIGSLLMPWKELKSIKRNFWLITKNENQENKKTKTN